MQTDKVRNQLLLRLITVISLLLAMSVSSGILYAQEAKRRVTGTITDQSGEVLIGVNVRIKGTNAGTVSDIDGKYVVMVPENAVLQFSFVGFERQEIAVEDRSVIDVVMEEEVLNTIEPAKYVILTSEQREKANADNGFAFGMFREISKLQGENTFFSPFSLNMAMGMLYNGASVNTRKEMDIVLNTVGFSEFEFNNYYQTISQELLAIDPTTEIAIANAIWYHKVFQVKEAFIETGKNFFDADIVALDFNDAKSVNFINDWCSSKTAGRIGNMVSHLNQDHRMILTNALYFKSKWEKEKKFDKEKTKPDDFTKNDQTKTKVNMMEQTTSLPYYADPYLQCVEMPYGNKAFSMIAILPPEEGNIDQLIDHLSSVKWDRITNEMKQQRVWLKIPRFKMECDLSLNQPLINTGIRQTFNGEFPNIANEDIPISNVLQKIFVEVNEEGTEAAAITNIMIVAYGIIRIPGGPIPFFANRPFLFLIREKSTGVILFIGRIDDPRE